LDSGLVERARLGDEDAFAVLAVQLGDRLYATAHHILRDTGRAEDATQQALIELWRHLPQLQDPERFEAWAFRILVRAAYEEARRTKRWNLAPISVARAPLSARDHAGDIADRDELERGFARLSIEHRTVVVLKHYSGLSNDEIAAALGIPAGTVRSRLYNAMQLLRAALEADARVAPVGETP